MDRFHNDVLHHKANKCIIAYNLLSKDKSEDAKELMDEFYKEKYPIEEEVEED